MMKIILFLLFGLGLSGLISAQAIPQSVITPNAGSAVAGNIALDWTLGEPIVESVYTDQRMYTQGFHQPVLRVTAIHPYTNSILSPRSGNMEITAVPNPVSSLLILSLKDMPHKEIEVIMSNNTGQIILTKTINTESGKAEMDLSELASGLFFLNLYTQDQELLKVFRVVKN